MKGLALAVMCGVLSMLAGCASNSDTLPFAHPNLHRAARINTQLGVDYMRQGDEQRALTKLKLALSEDPGYAEAHAALGYLYYRTGQPLDAKRQFQRALSLNGSPDTHNLYGVFLCSQGKYTKAFRQFAAAYNAQSNQSPEVALTNAGVCARRQAHNARARRLFGRALRDNTRYAPALLQMADLNYLHGQYLQAEGFMQRYQAVKASSAESLYLAYRIEQALGHAGVADAYRRKLLSKFPNSSQSAQLLGTQRHE